MVGGIGGNIQYSGGYDGGSYGGSDDDNYHDEIFQWTGDDWEEVGKMKMARAGQAVSTIRLDDDAMQFCG